MKSKEDEELGHVNIIFAGHRGYGATQVQSQRGELQRFPKNSLISFQKVMEAGADSIEFDLYLSKDDRLMVIHDNDLSINARYILQDGDQLPDGKNVGDTVRINANENFVKEWDANDLKQRFDISYSRVQNQDGRFVPGGASLMPPGLSEGEQRKYRQIPELHEVLELVVAENARRVETGLSRVKLNIELKGVGTGYHVQKVINDFNQTQNEQHKIKQEEIYYMSFYHNELARVAGLLPAKASNPNANLILGVPTDKQYTTVNPQDYSIEDPQLDKKN